MGWSQRASVTRTSIGSGYLVFLPRPELYAGAPAEAFMQRLRAAFAGE